MALGVYGEGMEGLRRGTTGGGGRARGTATPRAQLASITREILAHKQGAGRALYEAGVRLRRVHQDELWRAGSFAHFEDYLERAVDLSRTTAYRYIRLAEHFNADIAQRYGIEKLLLGLRLMDATPEHERAGDLLASTITYRNEHGRYQSVPFHEASTRQIRDAIDVLETRRSAKRRVSKAWRVKAAQCNLALGDPPAGIPKQRVTLRRTARGRIVANFRGIPVDELDAFVRALKKHLA